MSMGKAIAHRKHIIAALSGALLSLFVFFALFFVTAPALADTTDGASSSSATSVIPGISIGDDHLYRIVNVNNPQVVLQVNAASPQSGTAVTMAKRADSARQYFTFRETDDGFVTDRKSVV